eukprot:m.216473 g.216473  ORF g.216473 m.216473 type:complete len:65 (+) comp15879_c0_seq1:57-251(+)
MYCDRAPLDHQLNKKIAIHQRNCTLDFTIFLLGRPFVSNIVHFKWSSPTCQGSELAHTLATNTT